MLAAANPIFGSHRKIRQRDDVFLYQGVQRQEILAGRWRTPSFNVMSPAGQPSHLIIQRAFATTGGKVVPNGNF
jgi:hypothetical protein